MKLTVERRPEHGPWAVQISSYDADGDRLPYSDTVKNFASRAVRNKVATDLVADNGCAEAEAATAISNLYNQLVEEDEVKNQGGGQEKRDQASQLVKLAEEAELWHAPDKTVYASVVTGSYRDDWELNSTGFRHWLTETFHKKYDKAPSTNAIKDAIGVLASKGSRSGNQYQVFTRVAEEDGRIYLDLANQARQVVEIDTVGWRLIDIPPVRFRRSGSMWALPEPRKGSMDTLRVFLNFGPGDDAVWALYAACLVQALRGNSQYPPLVLHGEHGSAKSTAAGIFRKLIDPNASDLRSPPKNEADLFIQARNGWVLGFDNLSGISDWLSDCLCRVSTGGGMSTRQLYTNTDEVIFNGTRPIVLASIEEVATRADLTDRAVILNLPAISPEKRRLDSELWRDFDIAHPHILGGLLDAVSIGLGNLAQVRLDEYPRMADFARWAVACEPAFSVPEGTFLAAYTANRDNANRSAIEAATIGPYIQQLINDRPEGDWSGTMTELLAELVRIAPETITKQTSWPKRPSVLSNKLTTITPNLRAEGVHVERYKKDRNTKMVRIHSKRSETIVSGVSTVSTSLAINTGDDGDDGDAVSTDFRSATARKPDAIFEH